MNAEERPTSPAPQQKDNSHENADTGSTPRRNQDRRHTHIAPKTRAVFVCHRHRRVVFGSQRFQEARAVSTLPDVG